MNKRNQKRVKGRDQKTSTRWRTYSLMLVCGLTLVSGFFFAGRQHFSSMDYGMKNSRLRKQVDELEGEKRRLLLAREVSLSPAEIKKAVRRTGMIDTSPLEEVAHVEAAPKVKAVTASAAGTKPMIIKTSAVSMVQRPVPDPLPKTAKLIKPTKTSYPAE